MKLLPRLGYRVLPAIVLSLPWVFLFPGWVLFVGFVPLLWLEDRLAKQYGNDAPAVFLSFVFPCFFLWNLLSAWWLGLATISGVILFLFLNSILMSSVWFFYSKLKQKTSDILALIWLVAGWLAFEFLHLHWDMALPGMTLGGAFGNQPYLVQWYEFTGVLGGSLWILLANISVYKTLKWYREQGVFVKPVLILAAVLLIPVGMSVCRYFSYQEEGDSLSVAAVQPNINPFTEKFLESDRARQLQLMLAQTDSAFEKGASLVVLPETALPLLWEDSLEYSTSVARFVRLTKAREHVAIVLGVETVKLRKEAEHAGPVSRQWLDGRWFDEFNSALFIADSIHIPVYHKQILVSGVEKVPFARYFSFLKTSVLKLGDSIGGLSNEPGVGCFEMGDGIKLAPVICFESMFGDYLGHFARDGAGILLVMTNDGWWKKSPGARLHFSYSRLRAIELRKDVARSANTGISGFINQRGDVVQKTKWWTTGWVSADLHCNKQQTFYARHGDYIGRIAAFMAIALLLILFVPIRRTSTF